MNLFFEKKLPSYFKGNPKTIFENTKEVAINL
jgi:hypothetical protein